MRSQVFSSCSIRPLLSWRGTRVSDHCFSYFHHLRSVDPVSYAVPSDCGPLPLTIYLILVLSATHVKPLPSRLWNHPRQEVVLDHR